MPDKKVRKTILTVSSEKSAVRETASIEDCNKLFCELQNAIQTLEAFTQQNETEPIPHIFSKISSESSSISQLIRFGSYYVAACFSKRIRDRYDQMRNKVQSQVSAALSSIYKHRLFTNLSIAGQNPLADRITQTIERFNTLADKQSALTQARWPQRLLRYFIKQSGLSLDPQRVELPKRLSCNIEQQVAFHYLSGHTDQKVAQLTDKEQDLFYMKAITLCKAHGVVESVADALKMIRNTPIYTQVALPSDSTAEEFISLKQTLTPFPGEVIVVTGKIRKNGQWSSPLPDSFKLVMRREQTGFPHPSQHNGWALPEPLIIPLFPELQNLKLISLLQKREQVSEQLLPGGNLLQQAKLQLTLNRNTFHAHLLEFIALHRKLACLLTENAVDPGPFFNRIQASSNPYDLLSESYHRVNQLSIVLPYVTVRQHWVEIVQKEEAQDRLNLTRWYLDSTNGVESLEEPLLKAWGSKLAAASQRIILQYLAAPFEFTPPPLLPFDYVLQNIAYLQLDHFLKSLTMPEATCPLSQLLEREIALFSSGCELGIDANNCCV